MSPNTSDIAGRQVRVLIVDDNCDNRQLLEVILEWEGFLLFTAADGEDALSVVATTKLDLILLDVMMPGMNGYEVLAKIKGNAATSHIPVMMLSGIADRAARTLGAEAGADDFLTKPLNRETLVLRVQNLLRKTYADYREKVSADI